MNDKVVTPMSGYQRLQQKEQSEMDSVQNETVQQLMDNIGDAIKKLPLWGERLQWTINNLEGILANGEIRDMRRFAVINLARIECWMEKHFQTQPETLPGINLHFLKVKLNILIGQVDALMAAMRAEKDPRLKTAIEEYYDNM